MRKIFSLKYRPTNFDEVLGQEHITITLKNAIKLGMLSQAYLFSGPRGIGKTSTARILARAINCEKGPTTDPCNKCSSCIDIINGVSMDVFEIDGASNRGINEIRELRENVKYSASLNKRKIYIIDEVHMLTREAFNALLKTLEEPPEHVIFIFATTEPSKLPLTIISRCQRFDFHRIPIDIIIKQLRKIIETEEILIDDDALYQIAQKSVHSLRDAEMLLEQVCSYSSGKITLKDINELLGVVDKKLINDFINSIFDKNLIHGVKLIDHVFLSGYDLAQFISEVVQGLRQIYLFVTTGEKGYLEYTEEELENIKNVTGKTSDNFLLNLISIFLDVQSRIRYTDDQKILVETTFFKALRLNNLLSLTDLVRNLQELKPGEILQTPVQTPEAVVQKKKSSTFDYLKENWPEVIRRVKDEKGSISNMLAVGELKGISSGKLIIEFTSQYSYNEKFLNGPDNKKLVESIINKFLDSDFSVEFRLRKESTGEKLTNSGQESYNMNNIDEEKELIKNQDKFTKKIIEDFGGDIIKVE